MKKLAALVWTPLAGIFRRVGKMFNLIPKADLPFPFHKVLREELAQLRPDAPAARGNAGDDKEWLIGEAQVTDWDGLSTRWELLGMEDLWREVTGRGGHRFQTYVRELTESCSEALPRGQPVFRRVRKLLVSEGAEAAAPPTDGAVPSREILLERMADLVRAPKSLSRYKGFPKAQLPACTAKLANSLPEDEGHRAALLELNRLVLEDLFPNQIEKIYESNLEKAEKDMSAARLSALCLSGGGIRSATFGLGVLQALADRGVLQQFDYLSTVSGGGYIGSWLSAWLHHSGSTPPARVFDQLNAREPNARIPVEPKQILHLRRYSNYLAPRLGALSADTWVLIGTYLRNLFLNWLVFGPFLLAVCAIPRFCVAFLLTRDPSPALMDGFLWGGVALAILAVAYSCAAHPGAEGCRDETKRSQPVPDGGAKPTPGRQRRGKQMKEHIRLHGQVQFFVCCLAPLCISAILLTTFWFWLHTRETSFQSVLLFWSNPGDVSFVTYLLLGLLVTFTGWLLGQVWLVLKTRAVVKPHFPGVELGTGLVAGMLLYCAARFAFSEAHQRLGALETILYPCLASPLFLFIFLMAGTLFVGFSSRWSTDEDREWWARMGAWILVVAAVWGAFSTWILLGPLVFFVAAGWVSSIGGVSGLVTLILGHSGITAATRKTKEKEGNSGVLAGYAMSLAAPVFLLSILATLSLLTGWFIYLLGTLSMNLPRESVGRWLIGWAHFVEIQPWTSQGYLAIVEGTRRHLALNFMLLMLVLGGIVSLLVNINRFSLHAVYRNRLVRAYLGASNPKRQPNLFTGFDPADNFALGTLRETAAPGDPQKPLHIVNMALNLVGGKELAWQQRKAETFTASKLFTGNFRLGFRPTKEYASSELGRGLTLGTAMAISGAAANPNMGYHSSPVVAFLMTLFNIRLGCWLGNPGAAGQRTFKLAAPEMPVWYAVKEALGFSDEASGFVCLSDGGHFENLGLYEMILRRCQTIVVCDAGCDPSCSLEDLGNAIRKIRADLGVEIRMKRFDIHSRDEKEYQCGDQEERGRYCSVGDIIYESGATPGLLVYIKPAICGREPKDVFNYKQVNLQFPHESTADQFFSESQFESYRALGKWIVDRIYEVNNPLTVNPLEDFALRVSEYAGGEAAPALDTGRRAGSAVASGSQGTEGI